MTSRGFNKSCRKLDNWKVRPRYTCLSLKDRSINSEDWLSSRLTPGIATYSHWPGQAILCSCLDYYRLWYSFLSSLSHHEHVYLWPLVFISILFQTCRHYSHDVNKCLQAIDSSLDSSLWRQRSWNPAGAWSPALEEGSRWRPTMVTTRKDQGDIR